MAVIDIKQLSLPSAEEFHSASFKGSYEFSCLVARLEQLIHFVEDPLPYARVLQRLRRPAWYLSYENIEITRKFRDAIMNNLTKIHATVIYHPQMLVSTSEPERIALRWHSFGPSNNLYHYKESYTPNLFSFDRNGYSGWSELATFKNLSDIEFPSESIAGDFFQNFSRAYKDRQISKYPQKQINEVFVEPFIFIALQTLNDAVMKFRYHDDYLSSIKRAIECIHKHNIKVLIKRHPFCRDPRVDLFLKDIENMAQITTASVHQILPKASAVVVCNSGVGFEALLYEKPVICLGSSDYSHVCYKLDDLEKIDAALEFAHKGIEKAALYRFMYVMIRRFHVDLDCDKSFERALLRALCLYHLNGSAKL